MDSTCFRLHQLEAITNNFSEDRKVGSGYNADVYKAVHDGEDIAVKRLHPLHGLDDKDFHNELRNLNKARHKNIIRLIGYCHDTHMECVEYEGELVLASIVKKLLCFEYMQGGSLDKHIGDESCVLDWPTCYKIIQGTCEGLNHLHNAHEKPIFHLNLKPSHILLDKDMTPKITYFGLATWGASTEEEYQTEVIRGTSGYMPPEFIDNLIVSNKFDMFSLGIIMLKMMAGNKDYHPADLGLSHIQFIELVRRNWKRRLQGTLEHPSHDIDILRVCTCLEIAVRCVNVDREKRPCIEDIVCELEELEAKIKRKISLPPKESKDLILQVGSNPHHLSLQHLKEITDNFCDGRILGHGGFGVVYKGVQQSGKIVAVKKLVQSTLKSQTQFENEGGLLMALKHPNIVLLVGYCYETEISLMQYEGKFVSAEKTERFLCLEYMPRGSLHDYISDADESSGLDWPKRCKIIEGISFGLQYLHEKSVIHLDLKPANILLDKNFVPKITDFGQSRLFDRNQTIRTAAATGTLGYMAEEYRERGIITPMADIFSLGVMIMEVITGHRNYPYPDEIRTSSQDFIKREVQKWRNKLQEEPGYTSLEADIQKIERCIQIGLICVNREPTRRPTMKRVIDMFHGLESMKWYIRNELSIHDVQEEP
ncbi:protein STRUBBELIG-RECEPTOR FAMILY 7-like [Triticum dicoccoides]|uniref:protein STRUBBELIG-RECEPTOR FAMILY 7-like n=1 Tax=Triticum dicoccoides TaxID=85692 RepID=UPI0018902146|nr:protein STRUBBELIG-RECEPTOR FAMILY 7-like [Triticum dicoccoides]